MLASLTMLRDGICPRNREDRRRQLRLRLTTGACAKRCTMHMDAADMDRFYRIIPIHKTYRLVETLSDGSSRLLRTWRTEGEASHT
jgi:hypothetical protein